MGRFTGNPCNAALRAHILIEKENDMDRVRKIINAGRAYEKGYYGEDIGVAVLDTGERAILLLGACETQSFYEFHIQFKNFEKKYFHPTKGKECMLAPWKQDSKSHGSLC